MILAAGRGRRLRPLTDTVPKALIEVGGRPMIEFPLRMLAAAGVERIVVNLHHLGEQVREALGNGERYGVRIEYSPEEPILDTGGALVRARRLLGGDPFFLVNCDILIDPNLSELWALHATRSAVATLVLRTDPDAERYGAIDIDTSGQIRRFLGKPQRAEGPLERHMFCGVHVISPRLFEFMPTGGTFSITRDIYPRAHGAGALLLGYRYGGYWKDLGTPERLEEARRDLAAGRFQPSYLKRPLQP